MAAPSASIPDSPAGGLMAVATAPVAPALYDPRAKGRRAAALAAAFLLHAGILALVLARFPAEAPRLEPPSIPVELVPEAAPKPEAKASAAPRPEPRSQGARESGGDLERAPGESATATPPSAEPVPAPPPAPPTPEQPVPARELPLKTEASAPPLPVAPPVPPPEKRQAIIPVPPPERPPARSERESTLSGEGGGDRYLNAVRDDILRHRAYPPVVSALHLSGTAEFKMTVSRKGELLDLILVKSSGNMVLDQAGIETIKRSAPFKPVPDDILGDPIRLVLVLHMAP